MESWTGIISGTNRGLVFLNFEISEENKIVGTLRFFDAEGITLSGKVEGSIKGNVLEAKLFDVSPRQEGVPTEGTIILTISEDQIEMKGQWRTNIDTQGDCVLYKFSIATKPAMTESNLTLETKDISIFFCSFNKKHIEDIIKIMTEIAKSIRQDTESDKIITIISAGLKSKSFGESIVEIDFKIDNPYGIEFTVINYPSKISINGKEAGNGNVDDVIMVNSKGNESKGKIRYTLSNSKTLISLFGSLFSGKLEYETEGKLLINIMGFNIEFPYSMKGVLIKI